MSQMRIWGNPEQTVRVPYAKTYITPIPGASPLASRVCDIDGTTAWDELNPERNVPYVVTVDAPGFAPYRERHDNLFQDIDISLKPAAQQSGRLYVQNYDNQRFDFMTENDGKPWCLAGYATFTIMSEIQKGHDIGPILDEGILLGANTLVALGMDMGQFAHDHGFAVDPRDPNWQGWLVKLFDECAKRSMRCALGVFQQAQVLSDSETQQTWAKACEVARGRWNVLLRAGNEDDVNGWDHNELPRPQNMGGVLCSTGSRGINNPPVPQNWDFAEWEPRRDPFKKAIDDAGAGSWEMYDGYPGFPAVKMPIVCIEPPFFHESSHDQYGDFRWHEPWKALTLGLNIGANFCGGVFGSSASLECQPNGPVASECARQFFRGLKSGFQRY